MPLLPQSNVILASLEEIDLAYSALKQCSRADIASDHRGYETLAGCRVCSCVYSCRFRDALCDARQGLVVKSRRNRSLIGYAIRTAASIVSGKWCHLVRIIEQRYVCEDKEKAVNYLRNWWR